MRRPTVLLSGLLSVSMLALLGAPASAAPSVRWVDDDGRAGPVGCGGSAPSLKRIQPAIDAAKPGDTVRVCPGTYVGALSVGTANLRLVSSVARRAIIKAAPDHSDGGSLVDITAPDVQLKGFRLVARTAAPCTIVGAMVSVFRADRVRVSGVRTQTTGGQSLGPCGYLRGIAVTDADGVKVTGSGVTDFRMAGYDVSEATGILIRDSFAAYEHPGLDQPFDSGHAGLIAQSGSTGTVKRLQVWSLPTAGVSSPILNEGITLRDPVTVRDSTVRNTHLGIALIDSTASALVDGNTIIGATSRAIQLSAGVTGATISWNSVTGAKDYGILVTGSVGNTFDRNRVVAAVTYDCYDGTTGTGTQSTGNTWTASNYGPNDFPHLICPSP